MLKTTIPFVDLRGKTPIDLLRSYPDKAHELVSAARRTFGMLSWAASAPLLPLSDRASHAWLVRARNPYLYEIESFAEILGISGIYSLNLTYEWGCTSGAYRTDDTVSLLRVLDWPFPALGRELIVALQNGKAGEFYNLTWPAVSGVFTAMAPGRFAAALNQAPMRKHNLSFAGDWVKNRLLMRKQMNIPPSHLLRQVFEQAENYEMAKQMLTHMPIAMPVIYTLTGTEPGQGCIIERMEHTAEVRELAGSLQITTTNHFNSSLSETGDGWRPREIDSEGRYKQSRAIHGHDLQASHFDWLHAPILNKHTRLAAIADADTGRLVVQGFEGMAQVTDVFNLPVDAHE